MEWGVIEWGSSFSHRAQISKSGEVYVHHNGQYIVFLGGMPCIYIYIYIYLYNYIFQCVYIYIFAVLSWHSEHLNDSKKFVLEPPLETCLVLTASECEWGVEWHIPITKQGDENIFFEYKWKISAQDGNFRTAQEIFKVVLATAALYSEVKVKTSRSNLRNPNIGLDSR